MPERNAVKILITVVAVAATLQLAATPFFGDDLAYLGVFSGPNAHCDGFFDWLLNGARHWLNVNGRLANILFTVLLLLPKWLLACICGCFTAMMYSETIKQSGLSKNFTSAAILAGVMLFALPWWDYMMLFDCQFNYVFSCGMCLWAFRMIYTKPKSKLHLAVLSFACLACGMMHEAASFPLCIAVSLSIFLSGEKPNKVLFASFATGSLLVTFSPGIIIRALESGSKTPDDTLLMLLLKSDSAALLVALGIIIVVIRGKFRSFAASKTGVLAIASVISMAIGSASGIIGRTGWFAQTYAFIVIFTFISPTISRTPKIITAALLATMLFHATAVVAWQWKLSGEYDTFEKAYAASSDGIVYGDFTKDNAAPLITLNKTRGVPDADDTYLLICLARHLGKKDFPPIVLPSEVKTAVTENFSGTVTLSNGDIITSTKPKDAKPLETGFFITHCSGTECVVQPFTLHGKKYYHISPRILDPGDR